MKIAASDAILVREWDPDEFHFRVLEMESVGYVTRLETYSTTPEMDPETGAIIHVYSVEMVRPASETPD